MDYSKYTQGAQSDSSPAEEKDQSSGSPALLFAEASPDADSFAQNYKNYMKQRGKNVSQSFEKYMEGHASEFKHYVQSRGAGAAGDFKTYFKNYQNFFKDEGAEATGDFKKFVDQYASDYAKYLKACMSFSWLMFQRPYS